jgi:hypothetical protein
MSQKESTVLTGKKLAVVFVALSVSNINLVAMNEMFNFMAPYSLLSLLLIALDQTILGYHSALIFRLYADEFENSHRSPEDRLRACLLISALRVN